LNSLFKILLVLSLSTILTVCSYDEYQEGSNIVFDASEHLDELHSYEIENAETIAENHLENRLKFFIGMGVDLDLLNEELLKVIHYEFGDYIVAVGCCHTAFGFHKKYFELGDELYLQGFTNNVNWLTENMNDEYYFSYEFDWLHADSIFVEAGWISSMAQGEALAVYCMAYDLLGDQKYLKAADNIFTTLYTNTISHWCIDIDENNYYWQEELPNADHCHILNGFLFGTWGLWDYYSLTGNDLALSLFEASIQSIIDNHQIWDCEGVDGSRYCLHREHSDPNYHPIHLEQLTKYADFFEIDEFYSIVEEFRD